LPGANTLAYYNYDRKKLSRIGPRSTASRDFILRMYERELLKAVHEKEIKWQIL